jgi:outer membrane biosynthesis protein TonB
LNFSGASQDRLQPPAVVAPAPAAPSAVVQPPQSNSGPASSIARPAVNPSLPPAIASPSVLLEVSPEVPQAIREKIRGRVLVTVRVLVDPAGDVIGALMENPGPSKYFARLSGNAAREWKFAPASNRAPRVWLLTFAFTRDGVTARATAV